MIRKTIAEDNRKWRIVRQMLLVVALLAGQHFHASAKQYPVQIEPTVAMPSVYMSDYTTPQNMRVRVSLLDAQQKDLKVMLEVTLKKDESYVGKNRAEVTLKGGQATYLDYESLSMLFGANNFNGLGGYLSEGFWTVKFQAYSMAGTTEVEVSDPLASWSSFMVSLDDAPMPTLPQNGAEQQSINGHTTVLFSWMPRSFINHPDRPIKYKLKVVKVPDNVVPDAAIAGASDEVQGSCSVVDLFEANYILESSLMVPGETYAWQVTAYQYVDGHEVSNRFKNSGKSEVFTFKIKEDCDPVQPLLHQIVPDPETGGQMVRLSWNTSLKHNGYEVKYRKFGTPDPWSVVRLEPIFDSYDLDKTMIEEGAVYEYTVAALCNSWDNPEYGGMVTLQMQDCPPPGTIYIDKNDATGIDLSWDAAPEAMSYSLDYTRESATQTIADIVASGGTATASLPAIADGSYTLQLTTVCAGGHAMGAAQELHAGETGFVGPCPLPEPFALSVERLGGESSTSAKVSWPTTDLHESFVMRFCTYGQDASSMHETKVDYPMATLGNIAYGIRYLYEVEYVCKGGKTAVSPQGIFVLEKDDYLDPGQIDVTADCLWPAETDHDVRSETSVEFFWSKISCADQYQLFYKVKGTDNYEVFSTTGTRTKVQGLVAGQTYCYKVRVRSGGDYSLFSEEKEVDLSALTSNGDCDTIPYVKVGKKSSTGIQLLWRYEQDANGNAARTGYTIHYCLQSEDIKTDYSSEDIASGSTFEADHVVGNQVQYTIEGLSPSTDYAFRVFAKCGGETARPNSIIYATTDAESGGADCSSGAMCDRESAVPLSPAPTKGQIVYIADYELEITNIEETSVANYYSGEGILASNAPFVGFSDNIQLAGKFSDMFFNENACAREGQVDVSVEASLLSEEMREQVANVTEKVESTIDNINKELDKAGNVVAEAQDGAEDALYYFQGGDEIGMPKDGGGGLAVPYTSNESLSGQTPKPSGNGYSYGGVTIPQDDLPALVADKNKTVYCVTEDGTAVEVGSPGGPAGMQNQLPADVGVSVTFSAAPGMQYAFDPIRDEYGEQVAMQGHYLKLGETYYSAKAIVPQAVDYVNVTVSPKGTPIRFVNRDGFEYKLNGNTLTLAGGPAEDAQEIMAVYTKNGEDHLVGALLLASYPVRTRKVVVVLTEQGQSIGESQRQQLEDALNASFGSAGMYYTVAIDETSMVGKPWCGSPKCGAFKPNGSALLSNDYTGDEAAMVDFFASQNDSDDNDAAYLFAIGAAIDNSGGDEGGLQGKMNFDHQYGFLYNVSSSSDYSELGRTLSHEVGHGQYKLYHIFETMYLGEEAKEIPNLMSYSTSPSALELNKLQWDIIHKPGVTWGVFAQDKDQLNVEYTDIIELDGELQGVAISPVSHTFYTPAGYPFTFDEQEDLIISDNSFISITENEVPVPQGALCKFTYKGEKYYASYAKPKNTLQWFFNGYRKKSVDQEYLRDDFTHSFVEPYTINYFDGATLVEQTAEWYFSSPHQFPEGISAPGKTGEGPIASECIPIPCNELYQEYYPVLSQSPILKRLIDNDKCMLRGMRPMGEGLGYDTEFMKGLRSMVNAGVAVAFFPVVAEVMFPILIDNAIGLSRDALVYADTKLISYKSKDFAAGVSLDLSFQLAILHYFDGLPINAAILDELNYSDAVMSGMENLLDDDRIALAMNCLYEGFTEDGVFDENLNLQTFTEDCAREVVVSILADKLLGMSGKSFERLIAMAKVKPQVFARGLVRLGITDKDLALQICTSAKQKIPDSDADLLEGFIDDIQDDVKWKEFVDGKVLKRTLPSNLVSLTKKVHGRRITSAGITKSKRALGKIAEEFTDEQITELIKLNYLASDLPLADNPFSVSKAELKEIRDYLSGIAEEVGLPNKGTRMTKIQPIFWLNGVPRNPRGRADLPAIIPVDPEHRNVSNYVGREDDFMPVPTKDLVWDYRFDYEETPFQSFIDNNCQDDMGYAVIKAEYGDKTTLKFATGLNGDKKPNTRTGMLGNDSQLIFEYKMDERDLLPVDRLEIYGTDGVKHGTYRYNKNDGKWVLQE